MTNPDPNLTDHEQHAIRADARQRITELQRVIRTLEPDRDNPTVQAELRDFESQLASALTALETTPAANEPPAEPDQPDADQQLRQLVQNRRRFDRRTVEGFFGRSDTEPEDTAA